jgi:hypothetical protein
MSGNKEAYMSTMIRSSAAIVGPLMLLCALGCNVQTASETSSQTGAPTPTPVAEQAAARVKIAARAADIESSGAAPSVQAVARAGALTTRLNGVIANVPGSRVAFVDCEQVACSARLSASSLESLRATLDSVGQDQQGRIAFVARERLDPYQGRSFEADITLDTDAPRGVPADANELLDNGAAAAP